MSNFKVGDRIRCIESSDCDEKLFGKAGETYTVLGVTLDGLVRISPDDVFAEPRRFVLLDEYTVRLANEGMAAIRELAKQGGAECRHATDTAWQPIDGVIGDWEFRLPPPKPKFEPFALGERWWTTLTSDELQVGCKTLSAKSVKQALIALCNSEDSARVLKDGQTLYASRSGITTRADGQTYAVSWADADRLLKALNEAGVK